MKTRISYLLVMATAPIAFGGAAHAQSQDTLLTETAIPNNFDRDRNVSVLERPRPDYDPVGIQSGSFIFRPAVQIGAGITDNVFLTSVGGRGDGYAYFAPSIDIRSDLPRDQILANASATLGRYFKYVARNQNAFQLRALGRKDIGDAYSLTLETQYQRVYEGPESGAVDPSTTALSAYNRGFVAVRGRYAAGQFQGILAIDRTSFSFDNVELGNGTVVDQSSRDQVMYRFTGEVQYALSPSLSIYGQVGGSLIDYSRPLGLQRNRDSDGVRAIAGVNFDLSGLMRGKIGVGYVERDYRAPIYRDASGFSAEALVEFFPTELTTVGIAVNRTLKDTNISASGGAFFDNGVRLSVDHELLTNLLIGASGEYRRQVYLDTVERASFYRFSTNATYFLNREVGIRGLVYYQRRAVDNLANNRFNEVRAELSVVFRR